MSEYKMEILCKYSGQDKQCLLMDIGGRCIGYDICRYYTKMNHYMMLDMTHEEKLRALLPKINKCGKGYDNCAVCPYQHDCSIHEKIKLIDDCFNSLKSKVILREELLTEKEIEAIVGAPSTVSICERIFEAQKKKAGLV